MTVQGGYSPCGLGKVIEVRVIRTSVTCRLCVSCIHCQGEEVFSSDGPHSNHIRVVLYSGRVTVCCVAESENDRCQLNCMQELLSLQVGVFNVNVFKLECCSCSFTQVQSL